jgi:hypothetical protein
MKKPYQHRFNCILRKLHTEEYHVAMCKKKEKRSKPSSTRRFSHIWLSIKNKILLKSFYILAT